MKKLLFLLIFCISLFSLSAFAEDIPVLVEDPDPFGLGFEAEEVDPYEIGRAHV